MKMITIEEGSKDMLPYIIADIEPAVGGGLPFEWWYEISVWEKNEELGDYCWHRYYQKDGGALTLWRTMRKAREAVLEVYFELKSGTPPRSN